MDRLYRGEEDNRMNKRLKRVKKGVLILIATMLLITGAPLQGVAVGLPGATADMSGAVTGMKGAATGEAGAVADPSGAETSSGISETKTPSIAPESLEREYRFQDGQELPKIEETIVDEEGNRYRLVSSERPAADGSYDRPIQYYSWQDTKDIPLDGIDSLDWYFASNVYIEDGPFIGNIPLAASPYDVTYIYESFIGQVDRYYTIEGLPDNDAIRLPSQMDFTVSSDASQGATQIATLNLLSVDYEITGTNTLGLPNNYSAHLTYRGQETWLELHHYTVTAYYEGYVESNVGQYVIKSHYELIPEPVPVTAPTIPVVSVSPTAKQELTLVQMPNVSLSFGMATTVVVLVLAWLLLWLLLFRKNAKLVRLMGNDRRTLLRKHINVTAGEASLMVPDKVNLYDRAQYTVELKPRLANQQGELFVVWRGRIVAREELNPSIQIDMDSVVVDAVIGVVSETALSMGGLTTEA